MREILFKARRFDDMEWVDGFYVFDETSVIVKSLRHETGLDGKVNLTEVYMIDPATVCQYTGLVDKNGVKIFEGDIVRLVALANDHHQKGAVAILTIRYWCGNTCACFNYQESGTPLFPLVVNHEIEVLGNIYDNPELLDQSV